MRLALFTHRDDGSHDGVRFNNSFHPTFAVHPATVCEVLDDKEGGSRIIYANSHDGLPHTAKVQEGFNEVVRRLNDAMAPSGMRDERIPAPADRWLDAT